MSEAALRSLLLLAACAASGQDAYPADITPPVGTRDSVYHHLCALDLF